MYKLVRINLQVVLRITQKLGNAEAFCETESVNHMFAAITQIRSWGSNLCVK